ncbi:MAG: 50S ribosomal protein L17 [Deltaproteobacteria bacterium RBG_16_71_12]|nr:MAG: 50S ribosomal protein L17 [Deltaproteobacteria bacterium RBG_16_71_12]
MRHRNHGRKFSRTSAHRIALFRNMATALFRHERIETTIPKAKELRIFAERLITLAKAGDLHARRQAHRDIRDQDVLSKLFSDIGPRFKTRNGGYTRITKSRVRKGDNAPLSILELVGSEVPLSSGESKSTD